MKIVLFKTQSLFLLLFLLSFILPLTAASAEQSDNKDNITTEETSLKSLMRSGKSFLNSKPDSSIYYYEKALSISIQEKDSVTTAKIYNKLGLNFFTLGQLDSAIHYYTKLKIEKQKQSKPKGVGIAFNNIGNVYFVWGKYLEAEKYQNLALAIFKDINFENGLASCYVNLSLIYENLSETNYSDTINYDVSIHYLEKALGIYKTINNQKGEANVYTNLGNIFANKDQLNKAYEYYQEEKKLRLLTKDKFGEAGCYNNIGLIQQKRNQIPEALEMAELSQALNLKLGNTQGICKSYYLKGLCYESLKKNDIAIQYFRDSYQLALENKYVDMIKVNTKKLSALYELEEDVNNAFIFYKKYIAINDSIVSEKSNQLITEIQTKYETAEKEAQIEQQSKALEIEKVSNQNKSLEIQQYQSNMLLLGLGLLLLIIVIVFLYVNHQVKQKAIRSEMEKKAIKANLKGQEEERYKIAEELHDDIGSKLAGASNILKNLVEDYPEIPILKNVEKEVSKSYKEVRLTSHRMAHYSKMNRGILEGIQEFIDEFNLFSKAEISFNNQCEGDLLVSNDIKLAIYRSVQELVINAVKHAQATKITCNLKVKDNTLYIEVVDDGIGFEDHQNQGIGLANIQERLQFLNGSLHLDSSPGAIVKIEIPV